MTIHWRRKIETETRMCSFLLNLISQRFYFCFTLRSLIRIRFRIGMLTHNKFPSLLHINTNSTKSFFRIKEASSKRICIFTIRLIHEFRWNRRKKINTQKRDYLKKEIREKVLSSFTHEILWLLSGEESLVIERVLLETFLFDPGGKFWGN